VRVARTGDAWTLPGPGAVPPEAEVVVVGHPDNPTGALDPAGAIAGLARPGRLLVVDESFMDFVPGERESLAGRRDLPGLVVVRSLTKLWTLPGIRAGYLLAPADAVAHLAAHRQPWSVSAPALAALAACAPDRETPARVARAVASARADLAARLATVPGVRTWPGAANFLLARGPAGVDLPAGLRARGIAVRPAETFPGLTREHVRVTVRGVHRRVGRNGRSRPGVSFPASTPLRPVEPLLLTRVAVQLLSVSPDTAPGRTATDRRAPALGARRSSAGH
jgi:histidinol-phosphate aminotransferase